MKLKVKVNGWYVKFKFIANDSSIAELERLFRINDNIVKFMVVKNESDIEAISVEDLTSLTEIRRDGFKTSIPDKTEQKIINAQDIFLSFIN